MKPEHMVCVIYAGVNGYLDRMETNKIPQFEKLFLEHMKSQHSGMIEDIKKTTVLSDDNDKKLKEILKEWLPQSGLI